MSARNLVVVEGLEVPEEAPGPVVLAVAKGRDGRAEPGNDRRGNTARMTGRRP